jgi:hypothetical protein
MKLLRRLALLIAFIITLTCIVLLLNFTAPNPTGRRYSSAAPLVSGSAQNIGLSGEQILAQDLRLPRNDDPDQRQCICNNANAIPGDCNTCIAFSSTITTYRRPDFVGANFIAESKNRQNLLYTFTDQVEQISDYVTAAQLLKRPLWLYIRVDTRLDPEFYRLVESTGGGVVTYFTTPGYVDPVDQTSRSLLVGTLVILAILGVWEIGARGLAAPPRPKDPLTRAERKTDTAESFMKAAKDRAQGKIDVEDTRHNGKE